MAASTSNTPCALNTENSAAASSGPNASEPFVSNPMAEFAASRSRPRARAGTAARDAGWKTCPATARNATGTRSGGKEGNVEAMSVTRMPRNGLLARSYRAHNPRT